ncbi:MAG: phosphoribosyltransferase [Sphingomonadales bacterium]|nr:phosphoribosyltransferase [Sphingomonadales bacterium]
MFVDRREAGRKLAKRLARLRGERPLVLALPRGGIPVGYEVAKALDAELDIVIARKIGTPGQPELALGAIVDGEHPEVVINEDVMRAVSPSADFLEREKQSLLREIARREKVYRAGRKKPEVAGRTVIVVDDGIATGATVRAALHALRRAGPKRLVLATPVAPADTVALLEQDADEVICLETPEPFYAISLHYDAFPQLDDAEVTEILAQSWAARAQKAAASS